MDRLKIDIDTKFMTEPKNGRLLAESIDLYLGYEKIILDFHSKPPYDFTKLLFFRLWSNHSIDYIKDKISIQDKSIQGLIEIIGTEYKKQLIKK